MKFHWGHGITIFVGSFMIMIIYFVVSSFGHKSELVAVDYYQQEVNYQQQIEKKANALNWEVAIKQTSQGLEITFPKAVNQGNIHFFRPSNKELDFEVPIQLNDQYEQVVDLIEVKTGLWKIKFEWEKDGKHFFYEKSIVLS